MLATVVYLEAKAVDDALELFDVLMTNDLLARANRESRDEKARRYPAVSRDAGKLAGEALYLADDEDTALAEWYRSLAENNIPPREALPRDLSRIDLDVEVADLSTPERLASLNLLTPTPDRRGWSRFQKAGERLHRDGWAGIVAPSAARPSALVVCLFWPGPVMDGVQPVPPPVVWEETPTPPRGMRT